VPGGPTVDRDLDTTDDAAPSLAVPLIVKGWLTCAVAPLAGDVMAEVGGVVSVV